MRDNEGHIDQQARRGWSVFMFRFVRSVPVFVCVGLGHFLMIDVARMIGIRMRSGGGAEMYCGLKVLDFRGSANIQHQGRQHACEEDEGQNLAKRLKHGLADNAPNPKLQG
jgi:hypothetical protein